MPLKETERHNKLDKQHDELGGHPHVVLALLNGKKTPVGKYKLSKSDISLHDSV